MQTISENSSATDRSGRGPRGAFGAHPGDGMLPLLAGAAVAVAAVGAVLALADLESPLRGPFALFFLIAAPTGALATVLRGLEPWGRVVASVAGGVTVNLLVAQGMLATHTWSIRGGTAAVGALSLLIALLTLARRPDRARQAGASGTARSGTS
ncbi:hypothetical protein OG430_38080 [Streptomyces sp. NBC_01304]|nr:hypothetical protein OG430_38080 [Streptomyces sp. NBC_01304]